MTDRPIRLQFLKPRDLELGPHSAGPGSIGG